MATISSWTLTKTDISTVSASRKMTCMKSSKATLGMKRTDQLSELFSHVAINTSIDTPFDGLWCAMLNIVCFS